MLLIPYKFDAIVKTEEKGQVVAHIKGDIVLAQTIEEAETLVAGYYVAKYGPKTAVKVMVRDTIVPGYIGETTTDLSALPSQTIAQLDSGVAPAPALSLVPPVTAAPVIQSPVIAAPVIQPPMLNRIPDAPAMTFATAVVNDPNSFDPQVPMGDQKGFIGFAGQLGTTEQRETETNAPGAHQHTFVETPGQTFVHAPAFSPEYLRQLSEIAANLTPPLVPADPGHAHTITTQPVNQVSTPAVEPTHSISTD